MIWIFSVRGLKGNDLFIDFLFLGICDDRSGRSLFCCLDNLGIFDILIAMRSLLGSKTLGRYLYSNVTLKVTPADHSASLTLSNEKKRNPMSLETIREIYAALNEVQAKIQSDKIKVHES